MAIHQCVWANGLQSVPSSLCRSGLRGAETLLDWERHGFGAKCRGFKSRERSFQDEFHPLTNYVALGKSLLSR